MRNKRKPHISLRASDRCLIAIYLLIETGILFVSKVSIPFFDAFPSDALLYISIVCNLFMASYFYFGYGRKHNDRHSDLIVLALYVTLVADLFLTYLGNGFIIPGVICFCLVETVYAVYLNSPARSVLFRAILFSVLCIAAIATDNLSAVNVFAILNISILLLNVFDAWRSERFSAGFLFRIGITLFLCCDLCVGLSSVIDGAFGSTAGFLIWVFYIPSQVSITLSYIGSVTAKTLR